jgi:hypothetical protein
MSNRLFALAFAIGLAALGWVGYSFVGTSWLALVMTVVIAAVYLFGAFELRQFRAGTAGLRGALESLAQAPAALPDWLERVPAPLRPVVRARVEGERAALPGPALTPYLVGLLVMLGMLGTFLGMVVTFKGAVFALQGSTDLQAIRAALAEPIRGLGLSFGTSVAGVAASAMLGLMSAIARRERLEVARLLDSRIAGVLLPFSATHHRQETLRAMQAQIRTLPEVAQALQGVMERIERRSEQLDAQLLERHAQLQREVTGAYAELARQVGATLQETVAANARATGETVKPIVEQAMAQVVRESEKLHQRLGEATQAQAGTLQQAVAQVVGESQRLHQQLGEATQAQAGVLETAAARIAGESQQLHQRMGEVVQAQAGALEQAAAQVVNESRQLHQRLGEIAQAQAGTVEQAVAQVAADARQLHERLGQSAQAQADTLQQGVARLLDESQQLQQRMGEVAHSQVDALTERLAAAEQQRLHAWTQALEQTAQQVTDRAGTQALQALEQVTRALEQSRQLVDARAEAEARWLHEHGERMDRLAELWRTELGALRREESERGEAAVQRLSELQAAVAQHLATLGAALEAPITRLLHTASEVPQAAAGVITQLREEMGRVAERDNLALQERAQLLERLGALVGSLEQAAGEQRTAIEAMVGSATSVLEQSHARFAQVLEAQAGQAANVAAQATGSAVELASVAESFGESVRLFQASHDRLTDTLQRVEASLQKSTARSDEQLAYYVAQAREVIDLSIASQQGLVDSLRQLQGKGKAKPAAPVAESVE